MWGGGGCEQSRVEHRLPKINAQISDQISGPARVWAASSQPMIGVFRRLVMGSRKQQIAWHPARQAKDQWRGLRGERTRRRSAVADRDMIASRTLCDAAGWRAVIGEYRPLLRSMPSVGLHCEV